MASISPWSLWLSRGRLKLFHNPVVISALHTRLQVRESSKDATQEPQPQSRPEHRPTTKAITISRAMRAYMERARAHDDMMKAEVADYEIGKRHLANIMGEDPDNFTQADVDRAIEYLLPSGIFDKKARPLMKNPYEVFPKQKAAQFGLDGRPYHWMYFTTMPNYYSVLYDIAWKLEGLKAAEDSFWAEKKFDELEGKTINLASSEWISYDMFKGRLLENVQEKEYNHFIVLMERLAAHPLSQREEEFIMRYRKMLQIQSLEMAPPDIQYDSDGRCYAEAEGSRKDSEAVARVYKPGTGKFTVNNKDLSYFANNLFRESLMFPLSLTNLIGEVDIEAQAWYGGPTGQSGAIRLAVSKALTAFVDDTVREQLRLSGMLTKDPRVKERKKPGQEKARKKFTWKKR